jgi:4-amino-4-deoxy-L-arabinose transferase-like glycosyltransferase
VTSSRLQKIFWISLIVKLALAAVIPLTNDEAYYWVWSQHMQLSFFDHPPFVAWLFWLGQHMPAFGSMVRWPAVLLGQGTLALWLLILEPFFDEEQRIYWLLLALLSPLVGGTNLLVTPDLPLLFFNALALLLFYMWRKKSSWPLALAFGFAMGLGFTSKYVMVLFPLSLLPLILLSKQVRNPFFRQFPMIVAGVAAGTFPVWMWNIMNDFASFRFQAEHGLGHTVWKPSWTIEYTLAQIGLIFPPILYWALKGRRQLPRVFHLLAWVPLLFFLITTSRGYAEANWPIVAYPPILALAVSTIPASRRAIQITLRIWAMVMALAALVILAQPPWAKRLKFREFNEFQPIIERAQGLHPLYARSYQMAAKMHFELKEPVYKLRGMNRKDFYDYLPESDPEAKSYYLAVEKGDSLPVSYSSRGHKVVETIPVNDQFEIWRVEAQ